ncbi:hypothetical protein CKF58_08175, partial [Psittacicella hinzii]
APSRNKKPYCKIHKNFKKYLFFKFLSFLNADYYRSEKSLMQEIFKNIFKFLSKCLFFRKQKIKDFLLILGKI